MESVSLFMSGLCLGAVIGSNLASKKWADNAGRLQRIEHKGRLYKVERAD